jgi:hypothetical protein
MPEHPFPDSSVLTNSARSYLRRADFLMDELPNIDDLALSTELFSDKLPTVGSIDPLSTAELRVVVEACQGRL